MLPFGSLERSYSLSAIVPAISVSCCFRSEDISSVNRRFTSHTQTVTYSTIHDYKGVAQGAVLSPILFSIYVADITNNIPPTVSVLQYADDIAVYTAADTLNSTITNIESTVSTLSANLKQLGLGLIKS